jgi:hypothetical protein
LKAKKSHKYKEIMNDWNYDANYIPTLLLVLDLENINGSCFSHSIQTQTYSALPPLKKYF